jgi:RNA polymerase sigma-70 factor (ECF subfamily)
VFIAELTNHQASIYGYILASMANHHDAKDVLQRTNLVLWRKAANWDSDSNFLPWAFTVARFEVLAHYRDSGRDRHIFNPDVAEMMCETSSETLKHHTDRHDALSVCLKKVRDGDRQLLSAHYALGKPLKQIAEESGRKAGAVRIQIMRLRQALGKCIGRQLGAQP